MNKLTNKFIILCALVIISSVSVGFGLDLPSPKESYVVDTANVIEQNHERSLNLMLAELDQKTGFQYVILAIPSTEGEDVHDFAVRHGQKWGVGQKSKDNGLVFVMASKDKKYAFATGYGTESIITDAYSGQIGRDYLVPYAKSGNLSMAIYASNYQIIEKIAKYYGVKLGELKSGSAPAPKRASRLPSILFMIIFFSLFGGRMFLPFLLLSGSRGYGRSGFYGGGSFGGGGGSFGGGGFGGGGSSGGW